MINGTGDGGSSFASEMGNIPDWEEPRFLDIAKQARGWQVPSANLNSEKALASLPAGDTTATFFFSSFRDGNGNYVGTQPDLSGRFRVTITGGASAMTGFGVTNITQIDATTWEFDCNYVGNKSLTFTPTAFPIKATIVRTTDIAAHTAGGIFRQEFLDATPSGGCFRFMVWMGTNDSTVVNVSDYPVAASQRWDKVPMSVIVNLCNLKSADPWINIPHLATDALVTEWATYLRDNLDSSLRIRVELSNEIWNFQFAQATYFANQANTLWPSDADGLRWLSAAGRRFAQVMAIFNSVFAGQTNRLIGVIAGQAADAAKTSAMADAPRWLANDPGNYVAPHTRAREISIAPYLGLSGDKVAEGNAIKTQLDISQAAAVAYMKTLFPASVTLSKQRIDDHITVAVPRSCRLTFYEFNNHFDLNAYSGSNLYSGGSPVAGALETFIEATFSQEMADAQDEIRAHFKARNGSLMSFFVDANRASRFGTWGARTHFAHNSAIWNDLVAWHTANPRWWAR